MNFRFTKWKTIVAVLVGILLGFRGGYFMGWKGPPPSNWLAVKIETGIIVFVIVFAIVYIIWSLLTEKE